MKILHVIPSLGIGGTEKMLIELCRGLSSSRIHNEVVALKSGGAAADKLAGAGVPVKVLGSPDGLIAGILAFPKLYADLKLAIRDSRPDIVHTWLSRANVMGRLAARSAGVKTVVSSLRVMEVQKGYHLMAERRTASLADAVTVNSEALRVFAIEKIGIPPKKIRYIPNGIDASRPLDAALVESYRGQWTRPGQLRIGAVGRLHRQKGMDVLLEGAAKILEGAGSRRGEASDVHFLIAGDGPERANLEAQAERLGLKDSVTFCGWVKDSPEFIASLDLFVLPSRWEGMPNAVMEAMLASRPVIAANVSGVPELISPESEGLVVPPEDAGSLAAALRRLIHDAALRDELGKKARRKISEHFDLKNMISAHEELYRSLQS